MYTEVALYFCPSHIQSDIGGKKKKKQQSQQNQY